MEDKKHFDTPKVEVIEHLKHVRPVLEYVFFGTGLLAFFLAVFMLVLNWGSAMFGFRLLMSGLMLIMFYTFQRISAGLDSFFHIWKCGGKGVKLNENVWRRDTGEKGKDFFEDEKTTIWYLNVLQSTFFATGLIAFFLASFVFIARWSSWDSWIFICQASLTGLIVVMLYAFNSASVSFRRCAQALFQKGFEDALTSAFNFRYLEQRLEEEEERVKRYGGRLSILYMDMDKFKDVNDTYGHRAGDMVLGGTVEMIKDQIRSCDALIRVGGDEFVVLLPELDSKRAKEVGERLCENMRAESFEWEKGESVDSVRFSIGVATFPDDAESMEIIVTKADAAAYEVKNAGGDGVMLACDCKKQEIKERKTYVGEREM